MNSVTPRYYRTLYASLYDQRLASSSKQALYLNLLFKAFKTDPNPGRVRACVRRLVQVLVTNAGGCNEFVAGGLFLLGEVSLVTRINWFRFKYSDIVDWQLMGSIPGLRELFSPSMGSDSIYDPRKRDPEFANASASPLWELVRPQCFTRRR